MQKNKTGDSKVESNDNTEIPDGGKHQTSPASLRRNRVRNGELSGDFMQWNTVERAIKTEAETHEHNKKEWASPVGLCL